MLICTLEFCGSVNGKPDTGCGLVCPRIVTRGPVGMQELGSERTPPTTTTAAAEDPAESLDLRLRIEQVGEMSAVYHTSIEWLQKDGIDCGCRMPYVIVAGSWC